MILALKCLQISKLQQERSNFPNSFCMEIFRKTNSFLWEMAGKRKLPFPLPLRKLLGKGPFLQNFQHKEHGEISPLFAALSSLHSKQRRSETRQNIVSLAINCCQHVWNINLTLAQTLQ